MMHNLDQRDEIGMLCLRGVNLKGGVVIWVGIIGQLAKRPTGIQGVLISKTIHYVYA